ncbi:formylglycine-generating enzyme family protein [Leptothrix sp. BB-4]
MRRPGSMLAAALAALTALTGLGAATSSRAAGNAAAVPSAPWRDCEAVHCPWLVTLPAGSFLMGSPEKEPARLVDEGPQRRVTVAPVAIGQHEVTFAQWDACVAAGGCPAQPRDQGWGRGDRPVIHIDFERAQRFVAWLSGVTGQRYRLPSEAEWEYAARAGTTTPFGLGERIDPSIVNMAGGFTYNGSVRGIDRQRTVPVGSLPANAWGLHEMHGNVLEWTADCWHDDYRGAPKDARAWLKGCSQPDRHVLRGGSWYDRASDLRSAFRGGIYPGNEPATGLRVARELKP